MAGSEFKDNCSIHFWLQPNHIDSCFVLILTCIFTCHFKPIIFKRYWNPKLHIDCVDAPAVEAVFIRPDPKCICLWILRSQLCSNLPPQAERLSVEPGGCLCKINHSGSRWVQISPLKHQNESLSADQSVWNEFLCAQTFFTFYHERKMHCRSSWINYVSAMCRLHHLTDILFTLSIELASTGPIINSQTCWHSLNIEA